ncbi:MAG: formylmethanofuran dehydrogenase subunit C [Gemmatimonadaceae bacterium]
MSDEIVVTPHAIGEHTIEADAIAPDRLASLSQLEIARLPVWAGGRPARLGDIFSVRGERASTVRIDGDATHVDGLGSAMAGGTLHIEGSAGRRLGAGMTGGAIHVLGDTGDDAGSAMAGGLLRVGGRAGDRLGAARAGAAKGMTGGEIIVLGAAGSEAGAGARRGLIVVCGDVGAHAARGMIAGSVIVFGAAGAGAARWSKRGTLVVAGTVDVEPTFGFACTYRPPHLRLTLTYLRAKYALPIDDGYIHGLYRRYSGDMAELGKGEILQWVTE